MQDLAGYDLDLLEYFITKGITLLMVGDPRQATYSTNNNSKNSQYKGSNFLKYFEDKKLNEKITIETNELNTNHRCVEEICELSNELYPKFKVKCGNNNKVEHQGIFLVEKNNLDAYLKRYGTIMQLIYSTDNKNYHNKFPVKFWCSKGIRI